MWGPRATGSKSPHSQRIQLTGSSAAAGEQEEKVFLEKREAAVQCHRAQ